MADKAPEFLDLTVTDWRGGHRTRLQLVPSTATLAEVVGDGLRLLGLPPRTFYNAVVAGRELSSGDTLEEAGVQNGAEISLVPVLIAG